jgi:hypothetical protein
LILVTLAMKNLDAENFAEIAKAATCDAVGSRQELGRACAAEFSTNPETFDPKKLMVLGRPGLRAFADGMGVGITSVAPVAPPGSTSSPAQAEEAGWSSQEVGNIPFELIGTITGIFLGIVVVAAISLAAWIYT